MIIYRVTGNIRELEEPAIIGTNLPFMYIDFSFFVLISGLMPEANLPLLKEIDFENDAIARSEIKIALTNSKPLEELNELEKNIYDMCLIPSPEEQSALALKNIRDVAESYRVKFGSIYPNKAVSYVQKFITALFIIEAIDKGDTPNQDFIVTFSKEAERKGVSETDIARQILSKAKIIGIARDTIDDFIVVATDGVNKIISSQSSDIEKAKDIQVFLEKAESDVEIELEKLLKQI